MQVSIDKFGRVLIPKTVRDHLGIKPGTVLQISERDDEILLKLLTQKTSLQRENGILIFTGEAVSDIESAIEKEREERFKDLF